jgi:lysophospholipase L1-like esterase
VKSLSSVNARTRRLAAVIGGIALVLGAAAIAPAAAAPGPSPAVRHGWVASWAASPMAGSTTFSDQTVRNIIYTSVGGNSLRVQVSNTFGSGPLNVGAVSVGVVLDGAQLVPGTSHTLTFGGKTATTIAAGAQALSDPLTMNVRPLTELAVSVYLPTASGPATNHSDAQQNNYIAAGDHAGDPAATAYTSTTGSWYFVDGLDVYSATADGTVVAFGDSITDGFQSQTGANARWPNYLSRRLDAAMGAGAPAVADEGISGNRVLNNSPCFGVNALARYQRDVLSQPGAKDVIVLEGINDIGFSATPDTGCSVPNTNVTAAQIEAGYQQMISMAHSAGLKIFGATLTPFKGAAYWTPAGEAKREAVNNWIRTSHAFDGVIDFAKAVQDRFNPLYINPAYNSGDNLHPNDAGYEAMANAINLALLNS